MIHRMRALALLCSVVACNSPELCNKLAMSGELGAFVVGGGGPYEAYLVCDTLPGQPEPEPQTLMATTCAPATGDDVCLACVKASCCLEAVACAGESACACLVACRTAGETLTTCTATDACGEAEPAYDTALTCIDDHCAEQCPRLR